MLDHFVWSAKTQSYKRDTQLKNRCYVIKAIAMFQFTKVAEYKKTLKFQKVWLKTGRTKLKKTNCAQHCLANRKMQVYEAFIVHITYA